MDIIIPAGLWAANDTAVIGSWLYGDGEAVREGAVIVEIMVEKTSHEVLAPTSGRLQIDAAEEEEVTAGAVIGRIV